MNKEKQLLTCLSIACAIVMSTSFDVAHASNTIEQSDTADATPLAKPDDSLGNAPMPPIAEDNLRVRFGFGFEMASVFALDEAVLGPAVRSQLGIQFNNSFGIYAKPGAALLLIGGIGLDITVPVLAEFTLENNKLSFGIGPEFGFLLAATDGLDDSGAGPTFGGHGFIAINRSPKVSPTGRRDNSRFGLGVSVVTVDMTTTFVRGSIFFEYAYY